RPDPASPGSGRRVLSGFAVASSRSTRLPRYTRSTAWWTGTARYRSRPPAPYRPARPSRCFRLHAQSEGKKFSPTSQNAQTYPIFAAILTSNYLMMFWPQISWKHILPILSSLCFWGMSCGGPDLPPGQATQLDLVREWAEADPEWVSFHRPEWADDITGYQRYLRDLSPEGQQQRAARAKEVLSQLPADTVGWGRADRAHWEAAQDYLEREVERGEFMLHHDPLNAADGWLVQLTHMLIAGHTMILSEDADFYLARLQDIPRQARQVQAWEAARQNAGIGRHPLARAAADSMLVKWIAFPETAHPWYRSYARKMSGMDPVEMNENHATRNLVSAAVFIQERINPELRKLLELLRADQTKFQLPDARVYQHLLRFRSGTSVPGTDLHQLAQQELMYWDSIFQALPPQPVYKATRPGIDDPLLVLRQTMRGERKKVLGIFEGIPESIPRLIRWEATGLGFGPTYVPASLDGQRKAMILLPPSLADQPEGLMATYALGVPGLHQIASQGGLYSLAWQAWPQPGWVQGWSGYALQLLDRELMMMQADPALWWAYVHSQRSQALKLLIETGRYAEGWTEHDLQAYMSKVGNFPAAELQGVLVELYSSPGSAAGALWGETSLQNIRLKAQGDAAGLYLPPFHQQLMQLAGAPMDRVTDLWKVPGMLILDK
ncbi:MAG: DUF885 family protein, partial [Bacteroidota bacterium]